MIAFGAVDGKAADHLAATLDDSLRYDVPGHMSVQQQYAQRMGVSLGWRRLSNNTPHRLPVHIVAGGPAPDVHRERRLAFAAIAPREVCANDACLMPQGMDETCFPLYVPETSRTQRLSVDSESLNATEELDIL